MGPQHGARRRRARLLEGPLRQVYGSGAREQRCWVHKTGNVLNKLAQGSCKRKPRGRLQDMLVMAETRKDAELAPSTSSWKPTGRSTIKACGLPGQGPRRPADVLRLPRRALLQACTHDQPHREHVRHGSSAHLPDQGLPVAQDGDGHGLQTMPVRSEKMEKTRWIEPSRRDHSRRQIRRWRTPGSRRRMISPYTTFDNSSAFPGPKRQCRRLRSSIGDRPDAVRRSGSQ